MGITKGTYRKTIWDKLKETTGLYFRTLTAVQQKIIDGNYFTTGHTFEAVSSGASARVLFKTKDIPFHATLAVACGGDAFGSLYENAQISDEGTELSVLSHNRTNPKTNGMSPFHTPTMDSYETALFLNEYMPGGSIKQNFFGASSAAREEWILATNTYYVLEVVNKSNSEDIVSIIASFYESEKLLS